MMPKFRMMPIPMPMPSKSPDDDFEADALYKLYINFNIMNIEEAIVIPHTVFIYITSFGRYFLNVQILK